LPDTGGTSGTHALLAPPDSKHQGRLDFEQQHQENHTFAQKMTSNFQQNPEDTTR